MKLIATWLILVLLAAGCVAVPGPVSDCTCGAPAPTPPCP
jgi:hypothetical protein